MRGNGLSSFCYSKSSLILIFLRLCRCIYRSKQTSTIFPLKSFLKRTKHVWRGPRLQTRTIISSFYLGGREYTQTCSRFPRISRRPRRPWRWQQQLLSHFLFVVWTGFAAAVTEYNQEG